MNLLHSTFFRLVTLTLLNFAYSAGSVNAQITSILTQTGSSESPVIRIEKQEIPVYQYYAFYDQKLEITPGPPMLITGPVFSNNDAYLMTYRGLDFDSSFESAGSLFHGRLIPGRFRDGPIRFKDSNGVYQSMRSEDVWLDSLHPDFLELAEERWEGQVQTKEFGVRPFDSGFGLHRHVNSAFSVGSLLPDGSINESRNPGYAIIEPLLSKSHLAHKGDRELKKIAANASLVAKVTGQAPNYQVTLWKYVGASGSITYDPTTEMPRMVHVALPDGLIGAAAPDIRSINFEGNGVVEYYASDASLITSGLYDDREKREMNLVTVDVNRLRELVDPLDPAYIPFTDVDCPWRIDTGAISRGEYPAVINPDDPGGQVIEGVPTEIFNPELEWNGILYVQFPTLQHVASNNQPVERPDLVVPVRHADLALQMINASVMPREGLFLATNGPFYSVGHVNADGSPTTGSQTLPDNSEEPSVGFAGECFNILSEGWYPDVNQGRSNSRGFFYSRPAVYTEFSGAILTGLVPSDSPFYSGGLENTIRLLENWKGHTLTHRGALGVLFEPEAHRTGLNLSYTQPYNPPIRQYGHHESLSNGNYPPFVPVLTRNYVPRIVIKEIMYAPQALSTKELDAGFNDPEDFEFIRFFNAEKDRVDLTGVALRGAVDYVFPDGYLLDAKTDFVLVKNKAAFVFRYGDDSIIAGSYDGALGNSGEEIILIGNRGEVVDEVIQRVRFDSEAPWPQNSAGQGYSLIQSHLSYESSLTDSEDWKASSSPLGFPAQESDYNYYSWLEEHFTQEEIDAGLLTEYLVDLENDGFNNLMEYAFGLSPFEFNSSNFIKHVLDDVTQDAFIDFSYRYLPGVADISYRVKQSFDLDTWIPAASYVHSIVKNEDGTKTMNIRQPINQEQSVFFTLEIEYSP